MEPGQQTSPAQAAQDALELRFEMATEAARDASRRKRKAAKAFNPLRQGGATLDDAFLATMKAWVRADMDLRSAIENRLQARDAWLDLWAAVKAQETVIERPRLLTHNPALSAWARTALGTQAPRGEQLRLIVPAARSDPGRGDDRER